MPISIWIGFAVAILIFLAVDLGLLHRNGHTPSIKEALLWTLLWVGLALSFNVLIYFLYEEHGAKASLEFFAGYVIEKSLSLDNIFVIAMIFSFYGVPGEYQQRVLTWGITCAFFLRLLMILGGTILIAKFHWMTYVLGAFLVFTAFKMLMGHGSPQIKDNWAVKLASKVFPVTHEFHGEHFFIKEGGRWMMTPLFLALIQVEVVDVLFAVDSIPAIFAVTNDPFIVFTSNVFAVLGLRALYFALVGMLQNFRYLKVSLAFVLLFVGIKMVIAPYVHIPIMVALGIILGILAMGILASLFPAANDRRSL